MGEYIVLGLIALGTAYLTMKKSWKEEQQPLQELSLNIARLTSAIDNMRANDLIRDRRIEKHGKEIDTLKEVTVKNEGRLKSLEDWRREKE